MKTVIFANGVLGARRQAVKCCRQAGLIIAVDGGIRHCEELDIRPHVLLGDLDSASKSLVTRAEAAGTELQRHPRDKDKTDLELALDLAAERGSTEADLFAALGGRWDMSLANLFLPAMAAYRAMRVTIHDTRTRICLLRGGDRLKINEAPGSRVSLLPLNGPARGVTLAGFQYPLTNFDLEFGTTLGISNVLLEHPAGITLEKGLLLCIVNSSPA
jgi:thiamine pyrophosphokinase